MVTLPPHRRAEQCSQPDVDHRRALSSAHGPKGVRQCLVELLHGLSHSRKSAAGCCSDLTVVGRWIESQVEIVGSTRMTVGAHGED